MDDIARPTSVQSGLGSSVPPALRKTGPHGVNQRSVTHEPVWECNDEPTGVSRSANGGRIRGPNSPAQTRQADWPRGRGDQEPTGRQRTMVRHAQRSPAAIQQASEDQHPHEGGGVRRVTPPPCLHDTLIPALRLGGELPAPPPPRGDTAHLGPLGYTRVFRVLHLSAYAKTLEKEQGWAVLWSSPTRTWGSGPNMQCPLPSTPRPQPWLQRRQKEGGRQLLTRMRRMTRQGTAVGVA